MSLLARNALVLLTALPMLASPGWCCIGWSQLCSSMLKAGGQPVAHVQPQQPETSQGLPSCCARRAQAQPATFAAIGHSGCLESTPGSSRAEASPCRCCEDSRSAAIAPVTKNLVALEAPLFVAWTPMPANVSAEVRSIDSTLQASGPPLRILQCVWRC